MNRHKSYVSPTQLTIEEALDILDIDKARGQLAFAYEKRGAIMKLRQKLGLPPKKRFSYWYENETWINNKYFGKMTKCSAVETLQSESIKDKMRNYNENGTIVNCLKMTIRDRWNNHQVIYSGTNYNEFMEVAKKYDER